MLASSGKSVRRLFLFFADLEPLAQRRKRNWTKSACVFVHFRCQPEQFDCLIKSGSSSLFASLGKDGQVCGDEEAVCLSCHEEAVWIRPDEESLQPLSGRFYL